MERWFGNNLIKWYFKNKRDLPWRNQKDPYKIWLSEIILQQTQVAQGLSYYLKFIEKYPRVKTLAKAGEDEVLKLWQGLGYYSRARNLLAAARHINDSFKGVFPTSYEDIRALKGVGDYTAAAIASFAYDLPHAVVDGNVYRLLSRVFGIETAIDTSPAKKEFRELAEELLDQKNAAVYNQAIMEFGSQYCRPVNPDCENCIFRSKCSAFRTGKVSLLPIKAKKIRIRSRFFNYIVLVDRNNQLLLNKRLRGDIWQGLYEFSLLETQKEMDFGLFPMTEEFQSFCGRDFNLLHVSKQYKHVLTHQHLYARFYVVKISSVFKSGRSVCTFKTIKNFAFSRLTEKFLNDCVLKELF